MKTVLHALLAALLSFCALPLRAQTVHLMMPSGMEGRAAYHAGHPGQGAVLLLHGFLQTGDFSTLQQLYEGLAEAGYTVLAPTLTLGVPDRKDSLDCGSLHLNNIGDEVGEIQAWVHWLARQDTGPIYLLGHSYGARLMILWAGLHPDGRVRGLLAISLVGGHPSGSRLATLRRRMRRLPPTRLVREPLSFCRRYTAPAAAYLSHLRWDDRCLLNAAARLRVPFFVVLGGADPNLTHAWAGRLEKAGARVTLLPAASHFMNGLHQFALLDWVLARLRDTGQS